MPSSSAEYAAAKPHCSRMCRSSGCASAFGSRSVSRNRSTEPPYAVAERAHRDAEERSDRHLEQAAARVAGEAVEEVGAQHRGHRRAVAAARLARDATEPVRLEALVDERDDLVAQVRVVPAGAGRVDVLRAADRGERVDENDKAPRRVALEQLRERGAEGGAVVPHLEAAGEALEDVDRRQVGCPLVGAGGAHTQSGRTCGSPSGLSRSASLSIVSSWSGTRRFSLAAARAAASEGDRLHQPVPLSPQQQSQQPSPPQQPSPQQSDTGPPFIDGHLYMLD